ncbi:25399_t:CDS:2, partial [Dentiscutata erythropus]
MKTNTLIYTSQKDIQSQPNIISHLKSILDNNYDIIHVDSKALSDESWQNTICCLIVPNGKFDLYHDELKRNYLGFGSGATYATKDLENQDDRNNLDFFFWVFIRNWIYHHCLTNQNNEFSILSQQIQLLADKTFRYFVDFEKFSNIRTLARYKDSSQLAIAQ